MMKGELKEIIENITIAGFTNFGYDDIANVCHLVNVNDPHKWCQVNLEVNNLKDYTYLIVRAKINFTIVTKIINNALNIEYNSKFLFSWANGDTITISEELFQRINSEDIRPTLKHDLTKKSIDEFYGQIEYIYDNFIIHFFGKYPKIETVDKEIIMKEPFHNLSKYLPGETIFKALVIMKLCENENYHNFLAEYKSNIENAINNGNSRYTSYYNNLIKLTEYLNTENYKQIV